MNKFGIFLLLATTVCLFSAASGTTCPSFDKKFLEDIKFIDMEDTCVTATEEQIKKEITASLKYMSMAAFFARDGVNRPGFSKLFFEAAGEEREHAYKLIEYLSMRGRFNNKKDMIPTTFNINIAALVKGAEEAKIFENLQHKVGTDNKQALVALDATKEKQGLVALQNALKLEVEVTKSIRELVKKCEEEFNHYHFVDYLTGEFLEEQYKGQRDLAGKIATLGKLADGNGAVLGEFLFDKQLL